MNDESKKELYSNAGLLFGFIQEAWSKHVSGRCLMTIDRHKMIVRISYHDGKIHVHRNFDLMQIPDDAIEDFASECVQIWYQKLEEYHLEKRNLKP